MARRLLHNISWLGAANLLVKPFWFGFITALSMRLLGAEEYGIMTAVLSVAAIAAAFTELGMIRYSTREIARDRTVADRFFTNFVVLRLGLIGIIWVGLLGAGYVFLGYEGPVLGALVFAGAYQFSLYLTEYCRALYEAFEDLRREAYMLVLEKALVIGGGLAGLWATRTAQGTLAGMALGMAATTLANVWWISRHLAAFRWPLLSWPFIRRALRIMIPFGLATLFSRIYFRVDIVMVEAFLGETAAGQYGGAYRILESLNLLPAVVAYAAVYPRLARLRHAGTRQPFHRLLRQSLLGLGAAGLCVAVGLTLLGPLVIHLLAPDPVFAPAGTTLQILTWTFPLLCFNSLLYAALMTLDDQAFPASVLGLSVLVNVGLNALFIPRWGLHGAAYTTILSEALLLCAYLLRFWRHPDRHRWPETSVP